jgi:hypothetical protein
MQFDMVRRAAIGIVCCVAMAGAGSAQDIQVPSPAPTEAIDAKAGSFYLQCDGNPNNMSAGESLARFVGAVTLLALFAPPVEQPDPAKRKFGEAGISACDQVIDGPKSEGQPLRRIPLILGRALHRIEIKDYPGALADVAKARGETAAAGLAGDPYFDRSMGVSFDMIEADALLRAGDVKHARDVSLRRISSYPYSYYSLVGADDYRAFARPLDPLGLARHQALARIMPGGLSMAASHLEEERRFAEAAAVRDSQDVLASGLGEDNRSVEPKASATVSHALAGQWQEADTRAKDARAGLAARAAAGKPDSNASAIVELLDLYDILRMAHDGKLASARRSFAARSQWMAPSFGQVIAANALLREGAAADELFGSLARTPDEMWRERRDQALATALESDKNNKRLWSRILPYASATDYERLSRQIWNGAKSKMIGKTENKLLNAFPVILYNADALTQVDGIMLHSAVVAKERGFPGFVLLMIPSNPNIGWVRFGKPGDPGFTVDRYLDADAVIAELKQVIPTPEDLVIRKAARQGKPKA